MLLDVPLRPYRYPKNIVKNQKYNILTFLPVVLFEQFRHFFNLYFLCICISQLFPAFAVGYLFTYMSPLAFVLAVTISKEAYDDFKRFLRDREANSSKYWKINADGTRKKIPSSSIRVGDIIFLEKNEKVPADLLFLRTHEKSGGAFIRTDQLDGETDWKLKVAVPSMQKLPDDSGLFKLNASVVAEAPQKDIHSFNGTFTYNPSLVADPSSCSYAEIMAAHSDPLSVENVLWMNTVLASGSAFGLVIYTGSDTRAVMNTSNPSNKYGLIEQELNRSAKALFLMSLIMAFAMVSLKGFFGPWYVYLSRFFILFSSIIPLSLRVNVDVARIVYSFNIMSKSKDPSDPNPSVEKPVDPLHPSDILVRNSSIPEELGRIGYLLSDKTGTLTQNDMELKKLHLGTISFSDSAESKSEIAYYLGLYKRSIRVSTNGSGSVGSPTQGTVPSHNTITNGTLGGTFMKRGKRDMSYRVHDVVQALSLCHNVTPSVEYPDNPNEKEIITYQASSPDEIAIVKWTASIGFSLYHRDRESISIRIDGMCALEEQDHPAIKNDVIREFKILELFPFTSESKRMGIIVQDKDTSELYFYIKGADVVMIPMVQRNDWLEEECDNLAREGLRTLVIGRKRISLEQFEEFKSAYTAAKLSMVDRTAACKQVVATYLENDIELLGLTGVEDRLQDDVKITLETLRNAGIKIWMLTGDKVETATCIGISSKLIPRNANVYQVQKLLGKSEGLNVLNYLTARLDHVLVIDGSSLQILLDEMPAEFVEVAICLPAVICCRCTPTQKADVARLIKSVAKTRVCCIGDGGNDVSMIQAADVGVGLVGKEGRQASLAADFSILQFRNLNRLILWHGRNCYKRTAKLSQFVIHRGVIIAVMQMVFSSIFYFAPIALYQGILAVGYCTVYTNFPVFSLIWDLDVPQNIALLYPELYKELVKGRCFSLKTFFSWILISIYQGGIIMLMAIWLFESEFIHIVSITFTALILNELLMVALQVKTWHYLMILAELLSVFIYVLSLKLLPEDFDIDFAMSGKFIWKVSLITFVSFVLLFVVNLLKRFINPPNYTKLT